MALSHISSGKDVRWLDVRKYQDGNRTFDLRPRLTRDHSRRRHVGEQLKKASRSPVVRNSAVTSPSVLREIASELTSKEEQLGPTLVDQLERLVVDFGEESPRVPKYLQEALSEIDLLVEDESSPHPAEQAEDLLKTRLPALLFFDDDARNLKSEYDLDVVRNERPPALGNLAKVADLDLRRLFQAASRGNRATVQGLVSRANDQLDEVFGAKWNQSDVSVRFHVDGTILHVQIEDEGRRFSTLGERSDGLRQFVALMAFATVEYAEETILLIDEAESHLHYDAQADLVQMFSTQQVAKKVIYTTHSAGCLPEDVGVGVRLVSTLPESSFSEVANWFWTDGEAGFAPLLFGMGARTLAFFPTRRALVVEGPSDLILLPTLFRQAIDAHHVGFQVVPGLSQVSKGELTLLELAGRSVCYLTDQDKGGEVLREQLKKAGIPQGRIFAVSSAELQARTLEDFIDANVFRVAVGQQVVKWNEEPVDLPATIPTSGRATWLDTWPAENDLNPISKRALAYEILDYLRSNPAADILDGRRRSVLVRLHGRLTAAMAPE